MSLTLRWLSFLIAIYHVALSQWYWKELTHLYCLSVNLPCILCIGNIILAIWHCSAINWIIVKVNVCVLVCVWYSIIFASYSSTYYMMQKWYYTTHTHFNDYPIYSTTVPSVLWCCWLGYRKGIRPIKNWVVGLLTSLSVWSEVQTCIWPSWCHCHSLSLASVKSRLVLPLFLIPAHPGSPGKRAVKRVYVCM